MARTRQLVFAMSLLALCWLAMMAAHELGHVVGAVVTGGSVERVVLHPLAISRTDVSPNPHAMLVVWAGPIIGCALPAFFAVIVPRPRVTLRNIAKFYAGFCLIANGAYIAIGSFDGVGDCRVMLETGSPPWSLVVFGAVTIPLGLVVWHQLGSLGKFLKQPSLVNWQLVYTTAMILAVTTVLEVCLSPR